MEGLRELRTRDSWNKFSAEAEQGAVNYGSRQIVNPRMSSYVINRKNGGVLEKCLSRRKDRGPRASFSIINRPRRRHCR